MPVNPLIKSLKPRSGRRIQRVTFAEVIRLSRTAVKKMRADGFKPDVLVGVGRGGWTPGVIVSNLLQNPKLYSVKCEYYDKLNRPTPHKPRISQTVGLKVKGKSVLIIDELTDTGNSLKRIVEHVISLGATNVRVLVLHHKTSSTFKPHYIGAKAGANVWLKYPWDVRCFA